MPSGEFTFPTQLTSYTIHYDIYNTAIITKLRVKIYFTGNIKLYVTADGGLHWEEIPNLISGIFTTYNLITTGSYVGYYIIGESGSVIYTKLDDNGNIVEPAITIEMT